MREGREPCTLALSGNEPRLRGRREGEEEERRGGGKEGGGEREYEWEEKEEQEKEEGWQTAIHYFLCPCAEPIFSSEDIMAQMPEEGRKFGIVDRNWRDIMGTAVQDSHALVVTAQENMLGRLNESNSLLEEIQKGLNDYLEKKRLYFPRCVGYRD